MHGELQEAAAAAELNQAAALLIQLDEGDLQGQLRIRTFLETVLNARGGDPPVVEYLTAALARMDDLMLGQCTLDEATADLNRLLEAAMDPDAAPPAASTAVSTEVAVAEVAGEVLHLPEDADLELLPDFVTESLEYIDSAEAALLALENDPRDGESINIVFRAFHTIKGTSAFLGLSAVTDLAHHAESLFSRVRDGEVPFSGPCADLALRSADTLKSLIHVISGAAPGDAIALPEGYREFLEILAAPDAALASGAAPLPEFRLGDILVAEGKIQRTDLEATASSESSDPLGIRLVREKGVRAADVAQALRRQKAADADNGSDAVVRVRTDRLDRLVDLVGELVVAESMVAQDPALGAGENHELAKKVGQVGKIVRELQDLSMAMRMVPLKGTFQKIARLVRDVSRKSGKQVSLVTVGEDTELDRNMVNVIGDPLVHMVRNAIDHGLELPAAREAAGKPASGVVRLSAYQAGGGVVVELQDDGRGLDRARIVAKAIDRGLIESDHGMSDEAIFQLIFAAGFSTADQVTDLSGRGVGMDVVRRNIESLRGRVNIRSRAGEGTTFSIHLPLTLAITDGMLVRVGDERYIISTLSIRTSFRPEPEMLSTVAGRGEMVMLHGEVIPVVRLHEAFAVAGATPELVEGLLVVVGEGRHRYALMVDELLGQQQFVAKPLGEGIQAVPGIAGGAILGDGRIGLILDQGELLNVWRSMQRKAAGRAA